MSDSFPIGTEAPRQALDTPGLAQLVQGRAVPLGEFLGASAAQSFEDNTSLGRAGLEARVRDAELFAPERDLAPISQQEWQDSEFARDGMAWRPGLTRAAARAMAEARDETLARRSLIEAGGGGAFRTVAGLAAGVAGALPTPENFIPFAGPALSAARSGMFGARVAAGAGRVAAMQSGEIGARLAAGAATGAFDATLGNLVIAPVIYADRTRWGDDIGWTEIVQDLAFGAAGGAVLGGAAGALLGRAAPGMPAQAAQDAAGGAQPSGGPDLPVATQDAALRSLTAAAAQMANGQEVDLALTPPAVRLELERVRLELARLRAMQQPEAGDGAGVAARAGARALEALAPARPGAEARVTTPGGLEAQVRWEVIEGADLITSNRLPDFAEDPRFPPALQNRDRSSAERQAEVIDRAARIRPEQLDASATTDTGAPIIGPDNLVESGNGRTLSLLMAYADDMPTAQAYRAYLVRAGFDDAATMRQPILVRRRLGEMDPATRQRFAQESNVATTEALTPAEQAMTDATRLNTQVLALLRNRDPAAAGNADFVRAFLAVLPGPEGRKFSEGGALTSDGAARLTRALAARAYDDPRLVARLANNPDALPGVGRALLDAAPELARLRAALDDGAIRPELDALPALTRAVQRIIATQEAGRPMGDALRQGDLVDPPGAVEQAMLELLLRHPSADRLGGVGRDTLADRLEAYARHATEAPRDPDMFGMPPPGLGAVLRAAFREAGLEPPAGLRNVELDTYAPPPRAADPAPGDPGAEPPLPTAAQRDPVAGAAAARGFDLADAGALRAEADRLAAAGTLPDDIRAALAEAQALEARAERAADAWQEAAACAVRG
jgi:hypothetical protein